MVDSRTLTAIIGLIASIVFSLVVYWQYDTLLVLLVVPFLPLLFRRGAEAESERAAQPRECPECGFRTTDPEFTHCPRDGSRLEA